MSSSSKPPSKPSSKRAIKRSGPQPSAELLARYSAIADGIVVLFPPYTEVVIHDLNTQTVVHVANNQSKRELGDESSLDDIEFDPDESVIGPYEKLGWDGRFEVALAADAPSGLIVGALGSAGFGRDDPAGAGGWTLPAAARATLPALRDLVGVAAVPHLNYTRPDFARGVSDGMVSVAFRPKRPLTAAGFTVV